ncbi:caspase domain-containing protein [Kribbella steppae]|uniref:Caspase domain-containing protein n=1 Tax=Kribbella steppae TaxID=2512223 RepID=A0A4R2H5T2_9ACTN|nr:caspase family protein [Kribbella steppae]TCO21182.1 caspase domain-containing protein [Kribbella steppae]
MDGSRIALVIANDQYDDPGLRALVAPAQDAAALAEVLADPSVGGFEVQVLHNAAAQEIRFAVEDFFADRAPEDLLMLHFSCHGLKNAAGELFLAVADTKPTRLASTAVAADFVNRQMADSRAQRIALFLDCCYGGAFPRGMVVRAAGEAQVRDAFAGQEQVGGGRGRVVVTASSAMEYAFEGGQLATDASAPSVFTSAVVDGLTTGEADRDGDGWVGLTELVGYVTDRVHRVTPNQNPQMWTFGSQGELLLARSRIRRITPAQLAPELLEAMESPLPAARFGVVDYLRERLLGSDLSQAYAAWQALQPMVNDDSRRVALAATEALEVGVPRMTPEVLDLGTAGEGEVRLDGAPIALIAVASSSVEWLRVEQDGAIIRVRAGAPEDQEASVVVSGPTGEWTIPVRLTMPETESEPPPPPPEPEPEPPQPAPQPEPPHLQPVVEMVPETVPEQRRQPRPEPRLEPARDLAEPSLKPPPEKRAEPAVRRVEPAAKLVESPPEKSVQPPAEQPAEERTEPTRDDVAFTPPWWLIGVLVVGAVILIYLNWPGPEGDPRYIWKDHDNTGWYVFRSWHDPEIVSSFGALLAALAARWSGPIALGIVAGCVGSLIADGLLILGGGIAYIEQNYWLGVTAVAGVMVGVLLIVLWPGRWPVWPVPPAGAALAVAGGILMLMSPLITNPNDGVAFVDVTKLALLEPVVPVALAWLALAASEVRARTWLAAAATTYALISIVAVIPAYTEGNSAAAFLTALFGNLLVIAGVLSRGLRLQSRP